MEGGRASERAKWVGLAEGIRLYVAITVIGGLLVSTFLTLVVIPVVYSLIDRKRWDRRPVGDMTPSGAGA